MLNNEYLDAKIRVDTEENEPIKEFFDLHTTQRFNFHTSMVFSARPTSTPIVPSNSSSTLLASDGRKESFEILFNLEMMIFCASMLEEVDEFPKISEQII